MTPSYGSNYPIPTAGAVGNATPTTCRDIDRRNLCGGLQPAGAAAAAVTASAAGASAASAGGQAAGAAVASGAGASASPSGLVTASCTVNMVALVPVVGLAQASLTASAATVATQPGQAVGWAKPGCVPNAVGASIASGNALSQASSTPTGNTASSASTAGKVTAASTATGRVPNLVIHTSGSGTDLVPAGVSTLTAQCWGPGGTGGTAGPKIGGGGGGAGAYCRTVIACTPGQTVNWSVGSTVGTASTVSAGTLSIPTMTAGSGTSATGSVHGNGGTASGGNQANVNGNPGSTGTNGANGNGGLAAAGTVAGDGSPYGAGGDGGFPPFGPGLHGQGGAVVLSYS